MGEESNQITDTHMSKKYNDIIYDCMMKANSASLSVSSNPHYNLLLVFYSAVEAFYTNTFFLFETTTIKAGKEKVNLAATLHGLMEALRGRFDLMRTQHDNQNENYYYETAGMIKKVHQMIMYGLQSRNMLVRMSNREMRGEESVDYWGELKSFEKGHIMNDEEMMEKLNQK